MATGTAMQETDPLDVPFKVVSNVTREEVYKACREMMGPHAPKPPDRPASVQRIRVHLGNRGSNDTIVKYRDAWLTENPCPSNDPAPAPAASPTSTAQMEQPASPQPPPVPEPKRAEQPEAKDSQAELTTALTLIRSEAAAEVERFKQVMQVLVEARTAQATADARLAERTDAEQRLQNERVIAHGRWVRRITAVSIIAVAIGLYVGWSVARLSAAPGPGGGPSPASAAPRLESTETPAAASTMQPVDKPQLPPPNPTPTSPQSASTPVDKPLDQQTPTLPITPKPPETSTAP